jgi:small subunit ribosomal protein S2
MVSDTVAEGGRVLFVGTKRQAAPVVANAARQSAQYFVNSRWLGGMLTNWQTISNSIARLKALEEQEAEGMQGLTKKERLNLSREMERLERDLGGIKDMGNLPDLLFVIDTNKESIALHEARRLGIPVVAIVDTNCDPDTVDVPVPGNDDAARAIELYCDLIAKAAIDGISRSSAAHGHDLGEAVEVLEEPALAAAEDAGVAEAAPVDEAPAEAAPAEAAPAPEEAPAAAEEAPAAAEEASEEDGPLFTAPEGKDDLKKISGVGPVLEQKLNDLGITTFAQIANFSNEDIVRVDDRLNFKGRIERDDWIGQATELAKQAS